MGDANPIRTLGDYSKPIHEGYRNTIELPVGNNVDPNQHLMDFLKLVDSLNLNDENRERTHLHLFQFSLRDQASSWLEHIPARSITTWEDLTTRFLAQFFPPGRSAKLRNDILMFQQHHEESLFEEWTRFKDLLQKVPHYGIDLWLQVQIFYDHVNPILRRTIDQSAGGIVKDVEVHIGKLKLLNDFYVIDMKKDPENPFLIGRGFLATANAVIKCRMAKIAVGEGITRSVFGVKGVDLGEEEAPYWTTLGKRESYKPRPSSDGVGAKIPYYGIRDFLDCHFPGEWEISRDAEINPFKDVLVFRRMVEILGAIPLKSNMWESKDLIKNPINWDKPPKNEDGAWHAKIRLIDPDGEEFTKTLQSIPTTRRLSERESPREIVDLDHFYDT
ncbi:MAK10-like protein [Tanacetum coccineum]